MTNKGRILHAGDDQFEAYYANNSAYGSSVGFNSCITRKKPGGVAGQYQYKIGSSANLTTYGKDYASIITPKKPGEWIDVTTNGKDLYLYLECALSVSKRNTQDNRPLEYKISSARLITVEESALPKKFSGTFTKKPDKNNFYYYETTLVRAFLAVLTFSRSPIVYCITQDINILGYYLNGVTKVRV